MVTTFTGEPTLQQRQWIAVLHAGDRAMLGGLSALAWWGLKNWVRDEITVVVQNPLSYEPVEGVVFFRTRRDLDRLRHPTKAMPVSRVEPAALLFAAYDRSSRTAKGLLAAVVQQRLTTPERLLEELEELSTLRRSRMLRTALHDISGGAQSLSEMDVRRLCVRAGLRPPNRQVQRMDSRGQRRFTDCEWDLPDGRTLVLEVDGGFHMEVEHWEDDLQRQRRLTTDKRTVVRCTARELRDEADAVAADLLALGVPGLSA
ncbi:hypothetical protein [Knoellia koreensis]|uniref:DUF559 domain-containing protein n=1 Tax=Knoellia koreensis TaxID=2730921 RepID=A0A849HSU2_9MICO|nr:hypothetical protein [Knoellia sp. DB2414S]NNM47667.1 hypothetical protein [Knoellia sp. DB2414S]